MKPPTLAIVNHSALDRDEVQGVVRSVRKQVERDLFPAWGRAYDCALHAPEDDCAQARAALYLLDNPSLDQALEHHAEHASALPVGFVFTDIGDWSIALSHEVLELIVDPYLNCYVPGPDPQGDPDHEDWVWHSLDICDPVERTSYCIDEVAVSNFVTPAYFAGETASSGAACDFAGIGARAYRALDACHVDCFDRQSFKRKEIFGSTRIPGATGGSSRRWYAREGLRPQAGSAEDKRLAAWFERHGERGGSYPLQSFVRGRRRASRSRNTEVT